MTDQRDTPGPLRPEQVQAIRERMLRAVESEPGDFQCAKGEECEVCDGVLAVRQGAELLAALLADREQREGEIERLREALNEAHSREIRRGIELLLLERYRAGAYGAMVEDDDGPYVRWRDVRAALAVAPKED